MINAWWLAFVIPMSAAVGAAMMALCVVAKQADEEMEE